MSKPKDKASKSFAELMEELEQITAWLERDQKDIDEVMKRHQRGTELVQELQDRLQHAEQKIQHLEQSNE